MSATTKFLLACLATLAAIHSVGAAPAPIVSTPVPHPVIGSIERLDPALDALIAPGAAMEMLAEGFTWAEGPEY